MQWSGKLNLLYIVPVTSHVGYHRSAKVKRHLCILRYKVLKLLGLLLPDYFQKRHTVKVLWSDWKNEFVQALPSLFKDGNFNTKIAAAAVNLPGEILHYERNNKGELLKYRLYALHYTILKVIGIIGALNCTTMCANLAFDCVRDQNKFELQHSTSSPFMNLLQLFQTKHITSTQQCLGQYYQIKGYKLKSALKNGERYCAWNCCGPWKSGFQSSPTCLQSSRGFCPTR